ncbi:MAG: AMED_5909 family protein [Umezawaea sp.]
MATTKDLWSAASEARTLFEAHEILGRLQPAPNAVPTLWLDYYRHSIAIYERIAETDRGHHHEAPYWVARERRKHAEVDVGPDRSTPRR